MPAQIGYFDTLKSVAGKVFSYLASITITGTDGKTITVTQDTSLDEVVAMSSKAPKASPTFTTKIITPIIDLTGGQIAFPAAQAASADANTLDDYEEGDWTAAFVCGTSGTITINNSYKTGTYVKIGRKVTVIGYFVVASVSSPVGTLSISGLPFTCGGDLKNLSAVAIRAGAMEATAATALQGVVSRGTTSLLIEHFAAGVGSAAAADMKAASEITICATYFV